MRRLFALLALLLAGAAHADSCTGAVDITRAIREVREDGQLIASEIVAIPDRIPREWRSVRHRLSYRLALDDCPAAGAPRALFFFRVGGPFTVSAALGPLVPLRPGGHDEPPYNGRIGGVFILGPTPGEVRVDLVTLPNVSGGLIRVVAGPQSDVLAGPALPHHRYQQFSLMISIVLGMVGLLATLTGVLRRFDARVLWFAATCLVWSLRGQVLQMFGIPGDPYVYEQLNPLLLGTAAVLVNASTSRLTGGASSVHARILAAVGALVAVGFVATLALPALALPYRTACYALGYVMLVSAVVIVVRRRRQVRSAYAGWLAAGYTSVMLGGTHDILMVLGLSPAGWWTLLTPGFTLLLLCHLVVVVLYLLHNLQRAESANEELERTISLRSNELQASYALRQSLELEQAGQVAKEAERQRMVRDIHDGLGAQLMTALRGVERGALAPPQLVHLLQDSIDEVRLLMDSSDMDGTLPSALGAWRNRWGSRLAAAGVELHWQVDDSLDDVRLPGDVTLQVMRILQEATTNIIKHARAANMTVSARLEGEGGARRLRLEVTDDGVGLQAPAADSGNRGTKNMRFRARQIGAQLRIDGGAAGGTRVLLSVPML